MIFGNTAQPRTRGMRFQTSESNAVTDMGLDSHQAHIIGALGNMPVPGVAGGAAAGLPPTGSPKGYTELTYATN